MTNINEDQDWTWMGKDNPKVIHATDQSVELPIVIFFTPNQGTLL